MKFKLLPVLILAFAAHRPSLVSSIGTDMGDCACLCGLETNGGVVGEDGTSSTVSVSVFLKKISRVYKLKYVEKIKN